MKGSEAKLLGFMEGANNRYVIPVYQRKYDWKIENCNKLYEDLKKIYNGPHNPDHIFQNHREHGMIKKTQRIDKP